MNFRGWLRRRRSVIGEAGVRGGESREARDEVAAGRGGAQIRAVKLQSGVRAEGGLPIGDFAGPGGQVFRGQPGVAEFQSAVAAGSEEMDGGEAAVVGERRRNLFEAAFARIEECNIDG